MEWYLAGTLIMGGFLLALAMGMPIAFAFGVVSTFGLFFLAGGEKAISVIPMIAHETVNSFVLTALPLFILIAELLEFTGITDDLFRAVQNWIGRLPGGLGVATVLSCAGFGAVCGSSAATAATIGKIAIPQMLSRGYDKKLATGTISTSGTLGLMIPPSLSFIVYGVMTETSIGKLFIAGIIPGLILAVFFSLYIILRCIVSPALAPRPPGVSWRERLTSLARVWGVVLLALAILGTIYRGIATPTEAAAIGGVIVLMLAAVYRKLTFANVARALLRTTLTTGFIMLIIIGALIFAHLLAILDVPRQLSLLVERWQASPYIVLAGMGVVYFLLGMFMEGASILVLTAPLFAPIVQAMGFDLIWFGVIVTLYIELALITPPVGLNVYVIAGIAEPYGVSMEEVFRGILPYVVMVILGVVLITAFPELATWLPATMK